MQATREDFAISNDDACTFLLLFRIFQLEISARLVPRQLQSRVSQPTRRFKRDSIAITLLNYHYYCLNARDSVRVECRDSQAASHLPTFFSTSRSRLSHLF